VGHESIAHDPAYRKYCPLLDIFYHPLLASAEPVSGVNIKQCEHSAETVT